MSDSFLAAVLHRQTDTPLAPGYALLAAKMAPVVRALLVDNCDPAKSTHSPEMPTTQP